MRLRIGWLCALLMLWASLAFGAPEAPSAGAIVTIADGPSRLVREATRFSLAEGVRLVAADIVETEAATRLLRLEFGDGVIVDLGPRTRLLVAPRHAGDRARLAARFHLLQGWVKLTLPKEAAPAAGAFSTPAFDIEGVARSTVVSVGTTESFVFAESGEVLLRDRPAGKPAAAPVALKSQQFLVRGGDAKATPLARPTAAFLQAVPRPFVDTLPSRAALFKGRDTAPKPLGPIAYADVADWIDADGLRPIFLARWKGLARQPDFRKGLVDNIRAHPEWDRTLFPEKYLPKPAPKPASTQPPETPAYPR